MALILASDDCRATPRGGLWRLRLAALIVLAVVPAVDRDGLAAPDVSGGGARRLQYPLLHDPDARELLEAGLERARRWLGKPPVPVRDIEIRLSEPAVDDARAPRGFRATELRDARKGKFTIYVSARPGEPAFDGQLAHEIFHLFGPRLRDVYAEGLCTWLAARLLRDLERPWEPWEKHFEAGKEPFYGQSYFLVRDLAAAAGDEAVLRLLKFRRSVPGRSRGWPRAPNTPKMDASPQGIDVRAWLETLPRGARRRACTAIDRRRKRLETARRESHPDHFFQLPRRTQSGRQSEDRQSEDRQSENRQ